MRSTSQIPPSPSPLVTVAAATTATLPQLDAAVIAKFHPHAFVVSNLSDRAIVALVVVWSFAGTPEMPEPKAYMNTDSFMLPLRNGQVPQIVPPRGRILIAPGAFVREDLISTAHVGAPVGKMDGSSLPAVPPTATAQIDTVIFDDGEIVGPNETRYDSQIENRKMAATALAQQVRSAMAKGQDPKTVLLEVLASSPAREDSLGRWRQRYAQQLARQAEQSPQKFEQMLSTYENLPAVPKFFHK